jgi:hypothetical protein
MAMIRHFDPHHKFLKEGYKPRTVAKDVVDSEEQLAKESIVNRMMLDMEGMPRLKGVNSKNKNRVSKIINKSKKQTKKEQEQSRSNF